MLPVARRMRSFVFASCVLLTACGGTPLVWHNPSVDTIYTTRQSAGRFILQTPSSVVHGTVRFVDEGETYRLVLSRIGNVFLYAEGHYDGKAVVRGHGIDRNKTVRSDDILHTAIGIPLTMRDAARLLQGAVPVQTNKPHIPSVRSIEQDGIRRITIRFQEKELRLAVRSVR